MQVENMPNYGAVPPAEMAKLAEQAVMGKAKKHPEVTLILAIMAGIFVAIAGMFYTVVMAGALTVWPNWLAALPSVPA